VAETVTTTTTAPIGALTPQTPTNAAGLIALAIDNTTTPPPYSRAQFGDWIDVDHDCQNTRAEVLIAESAVPPTFTTASQCTVATGSWNDPWSGTMTTTAHALDIDHTVPLANAWRSGAWRWDHARRVAYANDLTDADHLLAIPAAENRSKSDGGPEAWRPPLRSTWCRYALDWDAIKARWGLTATTAEWGALSEMAATC